MSAVYVEITGTRGSAPRDAGAVMKVTRTSTEGTIGGGALEYRAIATARQMLATGTKERTETIPLGPDLGQCCGGAVSLRYGREHRGVQELSQLVVHRIEPDRPHPVHLWVWGAGHVGRAVIAQAHPQAFKITWVDDDAARFPPSRAVNRNVQRIVAADMPLLASRTAKNMHHLIFTYSHEIDFGLCAALLGRPCASIGLIGSETKRTRFFKRLQAIGLDPSPIICPIGDKSLGKRPDEIAQGTLAALFEIADHGWQSQKKVSRR